MKRLYSILLDAVAVLLISLCLGTIHLFYKYFQPYMMVDFIKIVLVSAVVGTIQRVVFLLLVNKRPSPSFITVFFVLSVISVFSVTVIFLLFEADGILGYKYLFINIFLIAVLLYIVSINYRLEAELNKNLRKKQEEILSLINTK